VSGVIHRGFYQLLHFAFFPLLCFCSPILVGLKASFNAMPEDELDIDIPEESEDLDEGEDDSVDSDLDDDDDM